MSTVSKALGLPLVLGSLLAAFVLLRPTPPAPGLSPGRRLPEPPAPDVAAAPAPQVLLPPEPRSAAPVAVETKSPAATEEEEAPLDPEHPDREELLRIPGWDAFYLEARKRCDPNQLTELLVRRLASELGLTDVQVAALRGLLRVEHAEAAREAIRLFGKPRLRLLLDCPAEQQGGHADVWKGLVETLEKARRLRDADYARVFEAAQLAAIDEHLRNGNLYLIDNHARDAFGTNTGDDRFRVVGIGRSTTGHGYAGMNDNTRELEYLSIPAALK